VARITTTASTPRSTLVQAFESLPAELPGDSLTPFREREFHWPRQLVPSHWRVDCKQVRRADAEGAASKEPTLFAVFVATRMSPREGAHPERACTTSVAQQR
jgi:hypothetical protein